MEPRGGSIEGGSRETHESLVAKYPGPKKGEPFSYGRIVHAPKKVKGYLLSYEGKLF